MVDVVDERLSALHVCAPIFARMDLPTGLAYLHNGAGTLYAYGQKWRGVSGAVGERLVAISDIRTTYLGEAASVTITLAGVDASFLREFHATRAQLEGRAADIWLGPFDVETVQPIGERIPLLVGGKLTSPELIAQGIGVRAIRLTIEGIWASRNFRTGGRWNGAGQRARFPGDLGMNFVGQKIVEYQK